MTQLALFPLTTVDYEPHQTLAERFDAFHQANPHVAGALEHLAALWFEAGNAKCSAKALAEALRWQVGLQTRGEPWKLNNSYVAFYARLLVERRPEWAGRFEFREQKSVAA